MSHVMTQVGDLVMTDKGLHRITRIEVERRTVEQDDKGVVGTLTRHLFGEPVRDDMTRNQAEK